MTRPRRRMAQDRQTLAQPSGSPGNVEVQLVDVLWASHHPDTEIHRWELSTGEAVVLGRELIAAAFEAEAPGNFDQVEVLVSVRFEKVEGKT